MRTTVLIQRVFDENPIPPGMNHFSLGVSSDVFRLLEEEGWVPFKAGPWYSRRWDEDWFLNHNERLEGFEAIIYPGWIFPKEIRLIRRANERLECIHGGQAA